MTIARIPSRAGVGHGPPDLVTGVVARAAVVVRARGQADGPAEPGHRQAMRDAQLLELSETPGCPHRRA